MLIGESPAPRCCETVRQSSTEDTASAKSASKKFQRIPQNVDKTGI